MVKYKKRRSRCASLSRKKCNDKKHKRRCRMTKRVKRKVTAVLAEIAPDACAKELPLFFHPVTAALANL